MKGFVVVDLIISFTLSTFQATDIAREALTGAARDNGADDDKFRQDLMNIARTTLSSKLLTQHKEHFSELAVNAVMGLRCAMI